MDAQAPSPHALPADTQVDRLSGAHIEPFLQSLARLRIEVFREFPYLYEGTLENEQRYLAEFASSPHSTLVVARVAGAVVGVATAVPLLEHGDAAELAVPFRSSSIDPARVCYFGESVLARPFRGRGIGHAFFDQREASAREGGFPIAAFCAVERPVTHPARPVHYVPHDAFWTRRGYLRRPDMVASFRWRDVGEHADSDKPMVCWLRELRA